MKRNYLLIFIFILILSLLQCAFAMQPKTAYHSQEQDIINQLVQEYSFDREYVTELIYNIRLLPEVIKRIKKPYERRPWYIYWRHFATKERILQGIAYRQKHHLDLLRAKKQYGVSPNIIIAIVGIETLYGKDKGIYPVLNTLVTLSVAYPRRAQFFREELIQYLLITRKLHLDPRKLYGSYAGAMGLPQFMPSSYRRYAVDYNGDNEKDLMHDTSDVIGSVANYLYSHGWQRGQPIAVPAEVTGEAYKKALNDNLAPVFTVEQLKKYGVKPMVPLSPDTRVNLIKLQDENSFEYWLGLKNFYVITTYNASIQYAMAVFKLSRAFNEVKQ